MGACRIPVDRDAVGAGDARAPPDTAAAGPGRPRAGGLERRHRDRRPALAGTPPGPVRGRPARAPSSAPPDHAIVLGRDSRIIRPPPLLIPCNTRRPGGAPRRAVTTPY